ncbi:MAG: DUF3343 domain-containing protein [Oscillospiraceae bacterium]|jgi:hypothetical protein|nr:DUF3343 domain-containing protein [Oscillospiraceae bacterium]
MNRVYFTVRSVTPGQKGSAALRRGGIDHRLVRAPRVIAPEGCAYALTVREAELGKAAGLLEREGVAVRGVFLRQEDGSFERVGP